MTHGLFTSMSRRMQRLQCSAGQSLLRRKLSGRVRQNCLGLPAPLTAVLQSRHTAVGTFAGLYHCDLGIQTLRHCTGVAVVCCAGHAIASDLGSYSYLVENYCLSFLLQYIYNVLFHS